MTQIIRSTKRRAPLLSIPVIALLLSGVSCRQAICNASKACLEIDVTADDGFTPAGPIEIVLFDRACNMLGRYRQPELAPSALPGLIEVRLDAKAEGPASINPDDVNRFVVLAWASDGGLPWTFAGSKKMGTQLSAQLHRPKTEFNQSREKKTGFTDIRELVATTDKAAQYIFLLDDTGLRGAAVQGLVIGSPMPIQSQTMNRPSLLSAIMIDSYARVSVNSHSVTKSFLETYLFDSSIMRNECAPGPYEIGNFMQTASWAIATNPSFDSKQIGGLAMAAITSSSSINEISSDCRTPFAKRSATPVATGITSGLEHFAIYPKAGQTDFMAIIVDDQLKVFHFKNGTVTDVSELALAPAVLPEDIRSLVFADMNLDGQTEIVMGTKSGDFLVFAEKNGKWDRSNLFPQPKKLTDYAGTEVSQIRLGDFNGDTIVDIALGIRANTLLYFGDGRGSFVQGSSPVNGEVKVMDAADLNAADSDSACADELIISDGSAISLYSMNP